MNPTALAWVSWLSLLGSALAAVRTYTFPIPRPTPGFVYEGWQAYNPEVLQEPPLPPAELTPVLDFPVQLDWSGQALNANPGPFIPGNFLGLSIEMAISESMIGSNASWVHPQFLNFMSLVKERGGSPLLRVGGNSQEKAYLVDSIDNGKATRRDLIGATGFTGTPTLVYTRGIIDAMREASNLLGISWIIGIPLNQSDPPRLDIVYLAEEVLGEHLRMLQLGNEPDLYGAHGYRDEAAYTEAVYVSEVQHILSIMETDPRVPDPNKIGLAGICECGTGWSMLDLIQTHNFFGLFRKYMNMLVVEHYPGANCEGHKHAEDQPVLDRLMRHSGAAQEEAQPLGFANRYNGLTPVAHEAGLPIILLETNTASCDGFVGIADAFGAAFWALDTALQLASRGWSNMMLHAGGHGASYNAFMSPPHNASAPFMWSAGPPMYALLMMAEAIGPKDNVRVGDLQLQGNNSWVAGYTIYEGGMPVRVVLFNYMSDSTGAHDYTARLLVQGSDEVFVRYFEAPGLAAKKNITYAGQTFGGTFESDGLLRGTQTTITIPCTGGSCPIPVAGPSIALVFLKRENVVFDAETDELKTFATTCTTKRANTAAVDGVTLATSNGINGEIRAQMKGKSTSLKVNPNYLPNSASSLTFDGGLLVLLVSVVVGTFTWML